MERNKDIARLLALYFEGMTTSEEERLLKDHFAAHGSPSLPPYAKEMFSLWETAAEDKCPPNTANALTAICGMEDTPTRKRGETASKYRWIFAGAAAACIAVSLLLIPKKEDSSIYCYLNGEPVTNIETASEQAQMAVRLLADGVNAARKGIEAVKGVGPTLEMVFAVANKAESVINANTCESSDTETAKDTLQKAEE